MENVVSAARAKIEILKQQIAELERFLQVYDELSSVGSSQPEGTSTGVWAGIKKDEGNIAPQKPVDKSRWRKRSRMKPDAVSDLMARIIREVGRPMTRGEIVEAFDNRDVEIPFDDKARYIGTIAWRNKGRFINVSGRGYWLRDLPLKDTPEPEPH